ncbi:SOS response-associated peptidase family protein [Microbulbifer epialgicus]|uniref:SOS response-associated peptidase family protein n=1 Tax=Microbulbifer epialgicus TaxID=393907 RepID=A0ABV4P387_9GAMM
MCSVFDVDNQAAMERFLDIYGIQHPERVIFSRRRRPTQQVSIVTERMGRPQVENAIWHLYLEKDGNQWKPHKKYWSINSNWKKLEQRPEYRRSRCLIPATAWVESLRGKNPVEFSYGEPFFFCGLFKTWGEILSCSIITLDAHPATKIYHEKSLPMVAPRDTDFVNNWLSSSAPTDQFTAFLQPHIEYDNCQLKVRPVARATSTEYTGDPITIS